MEFHHLELFPPLINNQKAALSKVQRLRHTEAAALYFYLLAALQQSVFIRRQHQVIGAQHQLSYGLSLCRPSNHDEAIGDLVHTVDLEAAGFRIFRGSLASDPIYSEVLDGGYFTFIRKDRCCDREIRSSYLRCVRNNTAGEPAGLWKVPLERKDELNEDDRQHSHWQDLPRH